MSRRFVKNGFSSGYGLLHLAATARIIKEKVEDFLNLLPDLLLSCPLTKATDAVPSGSDRPVQCGFSAQHVKEKNNSNLWFLVADHALGQSCFLGIRILLETHSSVYW